MRVTLSTTLGILCLQLATLTNGAVPPTAAELELMRGFPPEPDKRVTAENFMVSPYNRWAFQHMRELFPSRHVAASDHVWALKSEPVDIANIEVEITDGRRSTVGDWLASAYTDAFLVLDRGVVVHEQYENGQAPATPHIMFSVTKSLTGTLVLMLMEEGLVDASKTVGDYLPELRDGAFGDATVQQVMDMTNSISYDETYDDPQSDIAGFLAAMYLGGEGLYANLQGLRDKAPDFEHGDAFHYVTPDPEVLGWIVRRVTGKNLAQNLEERIWSRMGTEFDAYYWLDPMGVEMAGGGLSMSLRDAARFGQMILEDGRYGGEQVLSPAIAQRIKTKRNHDVFNRYYRDDWYENVAESYHDQWWGYTGEDAVVALGVHGQFIYINSEHDVVIVKQSSDPDAENDRVDSETPRVLHAIASYLGERRK